MRFSFKDHKLADLYTAGHGMNLHIDVIKAFSRAVQQIGAADDLRALHTVKGRRLEKLKGDRDGQYSIRLNNQYRLIFTLRTDVLDNVVVIIEIVDYH
jgi:proteic killer suppression protein